MKLYFHEVEKARPCILIVPGGGYAVVSPSEGEIVAKKFYEMGYQTASAKPNAVILSYPVITSGDCAHRGSFTALLGADASEEELEYMSLEKQVTEDMPPCFLWQTATDELVPVQNSFLFAQALQEKKIPYAFHVFSKGKHGLSLADEAWANEEFGEPYTLEQTFALGQAVNDGTFPVPEEAKQWPELADEWIRTTL